jgi:hypothetical protein
MTRRMLFPISAHGQDSVSGQDLHFDLEDGLALVFNFEHTLLKCLEDTKTKTKYNMSGLMKSLSFNVR